MRALTPSSENRTALVHTADLSLREITSSGAAVRMGATVGSNQQNFGAVPRRNQRNCTNVAMQYACGQILTFRLQLRGLPARVALI